VPGNESVRALYEPRRVFAVVQCRQGAGRGETLVVEGEVSTCRLKKPTGVVALQLLGTERLLNRVSVCPDNASPQTLT
jgi:hypothetical protein